MTITGHLQAASVRAVRTTRLDALARWSVRSQEVSRRNAMVSMTELTQRRAEREEVEEFLARHRQRYDAVG